MCWSTIRLKERTTDGAVMSGNAALASRLWCGRCCCGRHGDLSSAAFNDGPDSGTQLMVPAGGVSQFNCGALALRDEVKFKLGKLWHNFCVGASGGDPEFLVVCADNAVKQIRRAH